jgi:glycine cleavage system H protein
MKEIEDLNLPDNVRYSEEHEWAKVDGENIKVGISDYAQNQLGDIVFVELPQEGDTFASGDEFGTVESVKAVSELYIPVGGEIVSVNTELEDSPELVNTSPHDKGWMIEIKPADTAEMDSLMSKEDYINFLKGI